MERALRAVTAEEPSFPATAIRAEDQQWHLAAADWPAAPDDFCQ